LGGALDKVQDKVLDKVLDIGMDIGLKIAPFNDNLLNGPSVLTPTPVHQLLRFKKS